MQVRDHAVAAALDELAGLAAVGAAHGPPSFFSGYPPRKRYIVTMPVVIGFLRFQKRYSVFVCNDLVLP